MLMQSVAEFLKHLYGFIIAGCGRFCAQFADSIFESAAWHHEYKSGNRYMRVDVLLFRTAERFQKNLQQILLQTIAGPHIQALDALRVRPRSGRDADRHRRSYTQDILAKRGSNMCSTNNEILNTGEYGLSRHEGTNREAQRQM